MFPFLLCGGLSWLHVSFLLHVKYSISYLAGNGNKRHFVLSDWSKYTVEEPIAPAILNFKYEINSLC